MSHDDAMFFETVARALGERVCLIRQRGFTINRRDAGDDESDLIDLAASGWMPRLPVAWRRVRRAAISLRAMLRPS